MLATALACTAAACSGDRQAAAAAGIAAGDTAGGPVAAHAGAIPARRAGSALLAAHASRTSQGFASLPDHGNLVAYPGERVVRRAGPYTWHRADVSEAHALGAIVDGVLTITAPSGRELRFRYDRHVEHDSGDWTWIGHVVGGSAAQDAILTFGAGAVYGVIDQPGQAPLKLAMQDGASWLVETDVDARAAQSAASGRYDRPDFLVPPELPRAEGLRAQASGVRGAEAFPVGRKVVDVLVGYTDGFAQAAMGRAGVESNITTRLNFLVDVTNESYVNSEVNAEVRLVHSMQVSYPDATDNGDALAALTGSDGTTTPQLSNVDAALRPLHAARDQYGADLVSLVRDFQHPEAVSCGVAWLLGGGQTFLHAGYEIYGMSIVSDGEDGGFFCEDTTFGHELGHNMGLAHDVETAKGEDGVLDPEDYGRFAYSFGYKTALGSGNFYTIMAYGDEGQLGYHVFSNPDVDFCGGFPCGIEGQTDNAETLRQTMDIIASFRATVVPDEPDPLGDARSDFNGDGISDLLWRKSDTGQNTAWLSANAATPLAIGNVPNLDWKVLGTGDFDADGSSDIMWRNLANGQNIIWRSGNRDTTLAVSSVSTTWQLVGVGDFDGEGRADLLWRNASDGRNVIWFAANAQAAQSIGVVGGQWIVAGVGDFDGDGRDDLFWRNEVTGQNVIWHSANKDAATAVASVTGSAWQVVAVDDFNGDGRDDAFWRHRENGGNALWLGANAGTQQPVAAVGNPAWVVATSGDFNGDAQADLAWRNTSTGANTLWLSADAGNAQPIARITDLAWQIVP